MAEAKYRCWDRPWEALSADIERFHLDTIMDRINLQLHIAATWTIHEILRFKADMCSVKNEDRDEVRRSRPHNDLVEYSGGLVVSSKRELRNLIGIFDTLRAKAFALIGIKTYRKLDSETPIDSVLLFASDDINDDPYSMTLDELERSIPKADGVFAEMRKGFDKINAALQAQGADVKRGADAAERSEALVRAHVAPRPGDYEVTLQRMSEILARLNVRRDEKTIRRWEKYLSTGGREGTKPPEGYTLQTRLTLQSATAWAKHYAAQEKSKLNVKVSLERLTGGRQ